MEPYTDSFALPAGANSAIAVQDVMRAVASQLMQKAGTGTLNGAWRVQISVTPDREDYGLERTPQSANTDAPPDTRSQLFGARTLQQAPPHRERAALTPDPVADAEAEEQS